MKEPEIVRLLTVHIGMPKTGTTTLERHVYPNAPGYLGRTYGHDGRHLPSSAETLFDVYRMSWSAGDVRPALTAWLEPHLQHESLLVANEMLTLWGHPGQDQQFHPLSDYSHESGFRRVGPHPIRHFLEQLAACLPDHWSLRVVLTLRRQTTMLASQYAQESGGMRAASQLDLETKVERIVREVDGYYNYAGLVQSLQAVVKPQHLAVVFIEDGIASIVSAVREFVPSIPARFQADVEGQPRENVRATESGWPLRPRRLGASVPRSARMLQRILPAGVRTAVRRSLSRVDAWREEGAVTDRITLSEDLRTMIQTAYRDSNRTLESLLGGRLPPGYLD